MKKINILLFFVIFTIPIFSQTDCNIRNHYGDFINVEIYSNDSNIIFIPMTSEVDSNFCFARVINGNQIFINYLFKHFSSSQSYKHRFDEIKDTLILKKEYIHYLQNDTLFNSIMDELVAKSITSSLPKDTISIDVLLDFAVKFFSIKSITNEGYYVGKVCAGVKGIEQTMKVRKPFVEAFCFQSISQNYSNKEYSMLEEFKKAILELYNINLGNDKNEKLLRAEGIIYYIMRNNNNLKNMLIKEYEIYSDKLPFILIVK